MTATATGQNLPAPSRTVYKCISNSKVFYSDSPCLGAERIEVEPTRGVGRVKRTDVRREHLREMMAETVKPLTGMDAKQYNTFSRRNATARHECRALDNQLPKKEQALTAITVELRPEADKQLLKLRQRYRDLRC